MELLAVLFSFWVFYPAIAMLILMLVWVAHEAPSGYLTVTIFVFLLILQLLGRIPIWQSIVAHPIWALVSVAAYFVLGFPYSFFELSRFCRRISYSYQTQRDEFFANWKITKGEGQSMQEAWVESCRYQFPQFRNGTFSIRSYKGKILTWMMYWPWYLLWRLIHDLIKETWELIYLRFQEVYQKIANHYFADIIKDLSPNDKDRN